MQRLVPLFIMLALIVNVSVCAAEENSAKSVKKVGVVIIADDTFKKEKFFTATKNIAPKSKNYLVKVGDEMQSLWGNYCAEKNISPDKPPKTDELIEFTAQNNFHRVLALVIQDAKVGEYKIMDAYGKPVAPYSGGSARIQMSGYLFDGSTLIKTYSTVKHKTSEGMFSFNNEAHAGTAAFRLCVKDIGENMKDAW